VREGGLQRKGFNRESYGREDDTCPGFSGNKSWRAADWGGSRLHWDSINGSTVFLHGSSGGDFKKVVVTADGCTVRGAAQGGRVPKNSRDVEGR